MVKLPVINTFAGMKNLIVYDTLIGMQTLIIWNFQSFENFVQKGSSARLISSPEKILKCFL